MTAPLEGILVADFSRVLAGPMATMMLADLGARVIKVERPGTGDETRAWGPPFTTHSTSYFESVNRSKESIALDLADPDDLVVARELARRADVLIENFVPGTMDRFGLDHASVSADNPGIVYCSLTGYGSGAGRHLLGYDFVVQAVGGLMSITGTPDDPVKVGVAIVDVLTGKDAVIGILAALAARERTGRGDRLEVSLLMSSLAAMANQGQAALTTDRAPGRLGNRHPSIAPYETLRCADGLIAVGCGNDGQFARLTDVLGVPHLAEHPAYRTNPDRVAHRDALAADLEKALAGADGATWVERLTAAKVPAGRVGTLLDGISLADRLGLDPTLDLGTEHPPQLRHPIRWQTHRPRPASPPPALGEHTTDLRSWLATPDQRPRGDR